MQIIDLQDADDTQWDDIAHEQTTICRKFIYTNSTYSTSSTVQISKSFPCNRCIAEPPVLFILAGILMLLL